jgi:hypothetical protein
MSAANRQRKQTIRRNRQAPTPPRPPGDHSNRPATYTEHAPRVLAEIPPTPQMNAVHLQPGINSYLRVYRMEKCSIIITKEYGHWHLSIACPDRLPSWDEVSEARYRLIPDHVTMAMLLPPKVTYLNVHPNCLQMIEIDHAKL